MAFTLRRSSGSTASMCGRGYETEVRRFVDAEWMIDTGATWRLTRAGMLVSNEVLRTFV